MSGCLADALNRHGSSPLIVRTASGKWHGYYRHNGERRQIRPVRDVPIDILGGGYAVAPPSRFTKGEYEFIQGTLDDLACLPFMRVVQPEAAILPIVSLPPHWPRWKAAMAAIRSYSCSVCAPRVIVGILSKC
jgi:hypothetical protein